MLNGIRVKLLFDQKKEQKFWWTLGEPDWGKVTFARRREGLLLGEPKNTCQTRIGLKLLLTTRGTEFELDACPMGLG